MRVGAVIQARSSSTRLPGKVLKALPFGGHVSVLAQVARRVRMAALDAVVVATSVRPDDDAIEAVCVAEGVPCVRGDLDDVLGRYHLAATEHELDHVVRITADCPCVDYRIIDALVSEHLEHGADLTTNVVPRSYPRGLDVEVVSYAALSRAFAEASTAADREHVLPYIYTTRPDEFVIHAVTAPVELRFPDMRVTLDTPADYALLSGIYDLLGETFDSLDVVNLIHAHPWLQLVNCAEEMR